MGRMTATVHDSAQAPVYARLQEGSDAPDFTLPAIVPGTAENVLKRNSNAILLIYFWRIFRISILMALSRCITTVANR